MLVTERFSTSSNVHGLFGVDVRMGDDRRFMMVVASGKQRLALESVHSPLRPDNTRDEVTAWYEWEGSETLTDAFVPHSTDTVFNWPSRAEDGPLDDGAWKLVFATIDQDWEYRPGSDVNVVVQTKADPDLSVGTVRVKVATATTVRDDPDRSAAVDTAIETWRELWAPFGLSLDVEVQDVDFSPSLPASSAGSVALEELAYSTDDDQMLVLIGEAVGAGDVRGGDPGAVPNALVATRRSAVVVSWLAHAGPDGVLDADETAMLGQSLAHHAAHYMGVRHPVEPSWDAWDALDDTPICLDEEMCSRDFSDNVMFPLETCAGDCVPIYTEEQIGVMHRYVGTL